MKSVSKNVALAIAVLALNTAIVSAQNTTQQNGGGGANDGGTNAAAGNAGSTLMQENLFSTDGDSGASVGQLGQGSGRFATSRLSTQPLAGGQAGAGNQQFNQSFNRLLQVQTLQQTNRLGRQFGGAMSARAMIRPSLRIGFYVIRRPATAVNQSLDKRFEKLSSRLGQLAETRPAFTGVKFNVGDNGAVVLSGEVESDSARRLAANLIRMEPGIRKVTNALTVATQ